jgi:5-(carboxyamino)imidazole ribonucleotide synthase
MKNRIGIIGGGQLGRMLGFVAKQLGFIVTVIDPTPHSPAGQVVDRQIIASYGDEAAIRELASVSDFLTFEIELANSKLLDELVLQGVMINPSAKTLGIIKDKLGQSEFLRKAGLPVADFIKIETKEDILEAGKQFGYPFLLKSRFDAYDGRGNALIENEEDIEKGLNKLKGRKLYTERFVPFVNELAVVAARGVNGEIAVYDVVETVHKNNICHTVSMPAAVEKSVAKNAHDLAYKTMEHLDGAGVFGIEMFLTKGGEVVINEIAPRVHNSGHATIEGCVTSQFEQHIRAITGLPLGSTEMVAQAAVMVNILGERDGAVDVQGLEKALVIPNVSVHIYGKAETRRERKMGHVTATGRTLDEAMEKASQAKNLITI